MQYDCEQACPQAGLGQVCAQPRTDPTRSGDQNFNLPSTGVVDQIRSDGLEFHRCRVDQLGLISGKQRESGQEKMKNSINPTRKIWKMAEIQPDLARSSEISIIFGKISATSSQKNPNNRIYTFSPEK